MERAVKQLTHPVPSASSKSQKTVLTSLDDVFDSVLSSHPDEKVETPAKVQIDATPKPSTPAAQNSTPKPKKQPDGPCLLPNLPEPLVIEVKKILAVS